MKSDNEELDQAELLDFEKLMNFVQIFMVICLGLSYFLPMYRSANGDIETSSDFGLYFWPIPVLILNYLFISNHRQKAIIYLSSVIASLPVLFGNHFVANFKSNPLFGYYVVQTSIVILDVCWILLIIMTPQTAKIRRIETEAQAKIKKIMRFGLLGILLSLVVYQVGWSILIMYPEDGVIAYEPPPDYKYADYERYHESPDLIDGLMYVVTIEDWNQTRGPGEEKPLIAIISMRSFVNADEEKIHTQIRSSIEEWTWNAEQSYNMKLISEQEVTIRDQQVPLLFYKGTNESGAPVKELFSGIFTGNENRKVMLFITGKEAQWNQEEIDAFIKSIK